jgi:hypothetical protein
MDQFYENYFKPKMNYEFFLGKDNCDCKHQIAIVAVLTGLAFVLLDCVYNCVEKKQIETLRTENRSLRKVITSSIDIALIKLLKNGNDFEDSEEE